MWPQFWKAKLWPHWIHRYPTNFCLFVNFTIKSLQYTCIRNIIHRFFFFLLIDFEESGLALIHQNWIPSTCPNFGWQSIGFREEVKIVKKLWTDGHQTVLNRWSEKQVPLWLNQCKKRGYRDWTSNLWTLNFRVVVWIFRIIWIYLSDSCCPLHVYIVLVIMYGNSVYDFTYVFFLTWLVGGECCSTGWVLFSSAYVRVSVFWLF